MRQKPSFMGMQGQQPPKSQPLVGGGKKTSVGGPSLADLMNNYEENDYSTISLKMGSEAARMQVQVEQKSNGYGGYGGGEDWFRKQQQSPLRMNNKENINDQQGHRKKSVVEVNRFADCVRELEKNTYGGHQDEELAAFQPRVGNKSPLRSRTSAVPSTATSSLLRHAEEDLVFRAKGAQTKPVNFTDLSKRFNSGGDSTPTQMQKQPQTRSRSKLAPKISKQFQESDESEHDSEAVLLKESISEQKSKLFKFHSNMRPEQKEELERKVHQIKQDGLRVLAEKKSQNGNKVLPKFVEDIKVNVAREIEDFARNLMDHNIGGHHGEFVEQPQTNKLLFNPAQQADDSRRKKIIEETRSHIRDLVDVKEKKMSSFEEEDIRHITHPTPPPKSVFGGLRSQIDSAHSEDHNMEAMRQKQLQEQHELRRRLEEQRRLDEENLQRKLFEEEENRRKLEQEQYQRKMEEEQEASRREKIFAESERLRVQEEERLKLIQIEQARFEQQRAESERKMREYQLEQERIRAEEERFRQMEWEESERRRELQIENERRMLQEERRIEAERIQSKLIQEQRLLALEKEQVRKLELARQLEEEAQRIEWERAESERIRLAKLEQQRQMLIQIELMRKAEEERFEAEREHQRRVEEQHHRRLEEEHRIMMEMEEKRRLEERRFQQEQRQIEEERQRQQRRNEELQFERQLEQERLDRELAEKEAEKVRERLELEKEIEQARERERLLFLERQEQERRERMRMEHEERMRMDKQRADRIKEENEKSERERVEREVRQLEERQLRQVQERERIDREEREWAERTRLEEENRERIRIKMIEEERLLKLQMEEDSRRAEEERAKMMIVTHAPAPAPVFTPAPQPEQLRTSLKVQSLFTSYSIFQREPEPDVTPQDRINKLFDKARNDKPMNTDFKFDFGLDLGLDLEQDNKKRVTFDESTLNSRDRLPPYGSRRR